MKKLLCIDNNCTDPYFNLATEEFLLKNKTDDVFMLWINEPVVVVGKHQNAMAEVNLDFVQKENIKVARRLSGGGTVYHDLGNLNFTYIMNGEKGKLVDFTRYTNDILEVLNKLDVPAIRNQRNDLVINNEKFSGNAEHIFKQRVIHHGTLLFNSNLEVLNEAIKVKVGEYSDKAVQSVRSKVTNIVPYLSKNTTLNFLRDRLMQFMFKKYEHAIGYVLNDKELHEIDKLKTEKYATWDWIFGYSPKYVLKKVLKISNVQLDAELTIKKGQIIAVNFSGISKDNHEIQAISECLLGSRHHKDELLKKMLQNAGCQQIKSFSAKDIINQLF
ncbi:MAG: lipoate--protein ligase [Bacteroidales bacterium]|nr:lipoate--protein ligase [Bacteroidales bacterium]